MDNAPYALTSARVGCTVLASWLLLVGVSLAVVFSIRDPRELWRAEAVGMAVVLPLMGLWLASLTGLVIGLYSLVQPNGNKRWAWVGIVVNGLYTLAPLGMILAGSR